MIWIDHSALEVLVTDLFCAHQVTEPVARVVADSLVLANLKGHDSHGVQRVPQYLDWLARGWIDPHGQFSILREAPGLLHVDGGFQFGQVVGRQATELAIQKASGGVCVLSLRRSAHLGRMGEFAEMAAEAGMVFLALTNTHGGGVMVAPYGGREKRLSANPIAAGAPVPNGESLVMDIATAAIAEGKIKVAQAKGERLPAGCMVNHRGEESTDPNDYFNDPSCALLPFGGHKGFALSLFCDIFAGALSGAGCSTSGVDRIANAMLAIVIDPRAFAGSDFYEQEVGALTKHVKSCPPMQNVAEVLLPGEPETRERARREQEGISIADMTWNTLVTAASEKRVGIPCVRVAEGNETDKTSL